MAKKRLSPLEISKEEFRKTGYKLIDEISDFIETIHEKPVTPHESPTELKKVLGDAALPEDGNSVLDIVKESTQLLIDHSLFNGHPKFLGYITSSAAPIGALADLLAASVNPNVGAHMLSPIATEIEKQTIKWLAEFIGIPATCGGILVSGGNMANFTGFLAARTAKAPIHIKENGISSSTEKLTVYCSKITHIWIEKATILFGLGTNSIRWIETYDNLQMDISALEKSIKDDLSNGCIPLMVVGTAGDVSTGVIDNLDEISKICEKYNLWFHVDGAYGVPAAVVPDFKEKFRGIEKADSIALDPHKWLYSPLEAGCTLVKNPDYLLKTFSSHPEYFNFQGDHALNFYEYGLQNSRGFRALKVWMAIKQIGRKGYEKSISEDIYLAGLLCKLADEHEELQAMSQNLSIATFRYVPSDKKDDAEYLNTLNEELLNVLQTGGEVFLSNAVIHKNYCLRACIVNFRTSEKDIEEIIEIVVREGRKIHSKLHQG